MDAALDLAPAGARFTLLHVTLAEAADAARGAYAGLFGRAGRDPGARLDAMAAVSAGDLLAAAADRLGPGCDKREIHGSERAVVTASAQADLLIVAKGGDSVGLGPKSLGKAARFVVDHAACPVLLVWPRVRSRRGDHSPGATSPFPAATSPFPARSVNPRNPDTACDSL